MDRQILKDKVIILIGAGDGLGKVFTEEFLAEGAKVVMVGRNEERITAAAKELEGRGGETFPIRGDAASLDDAKRVFAAAIERFGHVDGLVTLAAQSSKCQSIEAVEDEQVNALIDTNLRGLVWWNREAMKHFLPRDSGVILNIGSNNNQHPICDAVYCATKMAAVGLTKQMAMRCVGTGVRVNLLNPGSFPSKTAAPSLNGTHMYDDVEKVQASGRIPVVNGSMLDIMKARTNRAVPVDLRQVAYAAVYLLSDLSRDVLGQVFTVDRGSYL